MSAAHLNWKIIVLGWLAEPEILKMLTKSVLNLCVVCTASKMYFSISLENTTRNLRKKGLWRATSLNLEFQKQLKTICFTANSSCRPLPSLVQCLNKIGNNLQRKEKAFNVQAFRYFDWISGYFLLIIESQILPESNTGKNVPKCGQGGYGTFWIKH